MSDIKLACDMAEQIKTICDKHGNKPGELINICMRHSICKGIYPRKRNGLSLPNLEFPYRKCMVSSLSILSLP